VTWAAFKPIRVLAPQLAGVQCPDSEICIDDLTKLDHARALREESVGFVESRVGKVANVPKYIFCSSEGCAKSFGITSNAAHHVGTFGIVIGSKGWQAHFVRHALIHHLQMEHLGSVHALMFTPNWFIEGMAYSLSEDPRRPLAQPFEEWRKQFESWRPAVSQQDFWVRARELR
jgi:hypothetical protein